MDAIVSLPTAVETVVDLDSDGVPESISITRNATQIRATVTKEARSAISMSLVSNIKLQEVTIAFN